MLIMKTAAGLAASAALLAIAGTAGSAPAFAKGDAAAAVHCYGVNSCMGTSDCKTAKNDCKGMNDCKGQGFKEESAKQCKTDGGSLTAPK